MEQDSWKVGELARATGLTVRTLHHWDKVGLVVPSGRTASGHRLYARADVERIYQVIALRQLGVPLPTIGSLLEGSSLLEDVLEQHRRVIDDQLAALRRLRAELGAMIAAAGSTEHRRSADFLALIRKVIVVDETVKKYFTKQQLADLAERREHEGEQIAAVQAAWPELIARVQRAVDDGVDPASAEGRGLGREWLALLEQFHRGDEQMRDSLYAMHAENSESIEREHGGPTQAQMEFITRATAGPGGGS
ncbi:MerR family transcriptional regulator [Georgenia subflava]|uniref:MerR family transcriptional regulator n=1 Tax=Georgenia subflava TaxID=1622177 RepID=UPI001D01BC3D|nr:MerR family transcriptional regulator [Georgenia subflava]